MVERADMLADFPEPSPALDQNALGRGIQRTMTLLAASTPERRNRVKILFYGQSITQQEWWHALADDLRRRFPHADLDIQNKAIGGFASDLLIRPAHYDLYPWYPDLVLLHVYGPHDCYDRLVHNIRSRTTAEVLLQNDHVAMWPDPTATAQTHKALWWDHVMNHTMLPAIAARYGCGLVDVRAGWLEYLRNQRAEPKQLLADDVHLNKWGNFLMARLVGQSFVYRPELPKSDWEKLVTDIPIEPKNWKDGTLTLPFEGNRVDAILKNNATGNANVTIDGKNPSAFDGCYAFTRPNPGPWQGPLFISQLHAGAPLVVEQWTYTVQEVRDANTAWTFTLRGSVTGDDGTGDSTQTFISHSRRVRVEPADYFRGFAPPLPPGTTLTWAVAAHFADTIDAPAAHPGRQITLAQGIPNGPHELKIQGAIDGLQSLRVYRPPVTREPPLPLPDPHAISQIRPPTATPRGTQGA